MTGPRPPAVREPGGAGADPVPAAPVEPAAPGRAGLGSAGRVVGGVLVCLGALEAATVECFLVPLRVGRWPVPVAVLAAVVGNVLLCRLIVLATGWRPAALLPPLLWLAVVLVFASPRGEGDLVVPGTWSGLAFLFLGGIAGAYGAFSSSMPPRPTPRPGQRPAPWPRPQQPPGAPGASGAPGAAAAPPGRG